MLRHAYLVGGLTATTPSFFVKEGPALLLSVPLAAVRRGHGQREHHLHTAHTPSQCTGLNRVTCCEER